VSTARDRIFGRVRAAVLGRQPTEHPGDFLGWRPSSSVADAVTGFTEMFTAAGGEVVRLASPDLASAWLEDFAASFAGVALGASLPDDFVPDLPLAQPESAELGVSMAVGAVAETGSLVLDARDGRRVQLLPPTHVVLVRREDVYPTLAEALKVVSRDPPSAVGLHSGPSKSADIGQILVKGVHGPGRVIAALMG
jgi:L-lactate dehydrogenase complex protein LldG